jgi:hypothetical protein
MELLILETDFEDETGIFTRFLKFKSILAALTFLYLFRILFVLRIALFKVRTFDFFEPLWAHVVKLWLRMNPFYKLRIQVE